MSKPTVSIQGEVHSFHDIARHHFFNNSSQMLGRDTFAQVFEDVAGGDALYGIVACENSLYGSINEVYDLLLKHDLWINGEIYLRIEHHLLGTQDASLGALREVHSHPVALAQCEHYLDEQLAHVERFEHHDTAGSAFDVAKWNDSAKAAIASRQAAEAAGLQILASNIETNEQNYTRFLVLQKSGANDTAETDKTSLLLRTSHTAGSLYHALGAFADHGLNLSKLESRPIIGKAWQYMFYVDIESGINSSEMQSALKQLEKDECTVRVLGSYTKGELVR